MNAIQLFESIGSIDDDILQHSERKRPPVKWLSLAACLVLVTAAVFALPHRGNDDASAVLQTEDTAALADTHTYSASVPEIPEYTWEMYCNTVETNVSVDSAKQYIPGYFTEELSKDELSAVIPGQITDWMSYSGTGCFDGGGNLLDVDLNVTTSNPECSISVKISDSETPICYTYDTSPVTSVCGGVEYTVYEFENAENVTLKAYALFNGACFTFRVTAPYEDMETVREDFKTVLECFTYYSDGSPDLSAVTAEYIPEWFDIKLTHSEALTEEDFGSYMPRELPADFTEESTRRFKDQSSDYLSTLWTYGYSEIYWRVSYFTENDEHRLTSVSDTENYNLALYPIPQAESVPEELREIVDDPIFDIEELTPEAVQSRAYTFDDAGDSDGYRMCFSVRYGDILVHVSTKGVDPGWLYNQLTSLKK